MTSVLWDLMFPSAAIAVMLEWGNGRPMQLLEEDELLELVPRRGSRPAIRREPHIQAEQFPPLDMADRIGGRILQLPHVQERESQIADRAVRAFWIPDEFASTAAKVFICSHEFCHLHPAPGTTLHMVLPDPIARQAAELGWCEPHPLANMGFLPRGLSVVYAPRTDAEFEIVMSLVHAAYRFATGSKNGN